MRTELKITFNDSDNNKLYLNDADGNLYSININKQFKDTFRGMI